MVPPRTSIIVSSILFAGVAGSFHWMLDLTMRFNGGKRIRTPN